MLRKALSINFNILKVVVDLKVKVVGAELSLLLYCNCAVAEGVSVSESFTVHKWCPPLKNTIPLHDPLLVSLLLILNHMMYTDCCYSRFSLIFPTFCFLHLFICFYYHPEWFFRNLLTLNISKCNFVIFGSPQKLNRNKIFWSK